MLKVGQALRVNLFPRTSLSTSSFSLSHTKRALATLSSNMNVTKDNFTEVLPSLLELIPSAKFIAFDEEMTGIFMVGGSGQKKTLLDSPQQRYLGMRDIAAKYNMIQFGICLFHEEPSSPGVLVARPFNFYVIPAPNKTVGPTVTMEMTAIDFNRQHGMDWQTWITKGLSYVTAREENYLNDQFNREVEQDKPEGGFIYGWDKKLTPLTTPDALESVEAFMVDFKEWYKHAIPNAYSAYCSDLPLPEPRFDYSDFEVEKTPTAVSVAASMDIADDGDANLDDIPLRQVSSEVFEENLSKLKFVMPRANGAVRKAMFSAAAEFILQQANGSAGKNIKAIDTVSSTISSETSTSTAFLPQYPEIAVRFRSFWDYKQESFILLSLQSIEQREQAARTEERRVLMESKIGVRAVYKAISQSKIPLVGHNCFFDILFMMHAFDADLPFSLESFRGTMARRLPSMYDTKLLFSSKEYASLDSAVTSEANNLGSLYEAFMKAMRLNNGTLSLPPSTTEVLSRDSADPSVITPVVSITPVTSVSVKPVPGVPTRYVGPTDVIFAEGFDAYTADDSKAHEAAFDAYMTGVVFSHLATALSEADRDKIDKVLDDASSNDSVSTLVDFSLPTLSNLRNTIFGMDSLYHHSLTPHAGYVLSPESTSAEPLYVPGTEYPLPGLRPFSGRPFVVSAIEDGATTTAPPTSFRNRNNANNVNLGALDAAVSELFTIDGVAGLGQGIFYRRISPSPAQYVVVVNGDEEALRTYSTPTGNTQWSVVPVEEYWVRMGAHDVPLSDADILAAALSNAAASANVTATGMTRKERLAAAAAATAASSSTSTTGSGKKLKRSFIGSLTAGARSFWSTFTESWYMTEEESPTDIDSKKRRM